MDCIAAKLFGGFEITFNGKEILFPYGKVQAVLFYLLVNKHATRNALANLLWSEKPEDTALKNLRNAIYLIKKNTKEDIFYFPNNSVIAFSPNIEVNIDVDTFINSNEAVDIYKGDFLKGFSIKASENFESWMLKTREYLEKTYLFRISNCIETEKKHKRYERVEYYSKILINYDEYNEEAYRNLIESYYYQDKINSAIASYDKLSSVLYNDLSIKPDEKTEKLFQKVQMKIKDRKTTVKPKEFFYGRYEELKFLKQNYNNFIDNLDATKAVLIKGEMGIGKTGLKDKFKEIINLRDAFVFEVNCYEFESENTLKPWRSIIAKMCKAVKNQKQEVPKNWTQIMNVMVPELITEGDKDKPVSSLGFLKPEVISEFLINITEEVLCEKKIVLIFEDIHWMDAVSLSILTNMIFDLSSENFMFVLTCRDDENSNIDKFLTIANQYHKLHILELPRFQFKEVETLLKNAMPEYPFEEKNIVKIFKETEGNTFFIAEYLSLLKCNKNINIMTSRMKDILKSRFIGISEEELQIIEIASIFDDEVPIYILEELIKKDSLEIISSVEKLQKKQILKEIKGNEISYKFTHQKLRQFVYLNLSEARRRILHNRSGKLIEKNLNGEKADINICYKLIYHFTNSNDFIPLLKYKIQLLNIYFNFSHEMFPILYCSNDANNQMYLDEAKTIKSLKEIKDLLDKLKRQGIKEEEYSELNIAYLHMFGRYLILKGEYEEGILYIKELIESAINSNNNYYAIEGYKQMAYYCIQINNPAEMVKFVDSGIHIALKAEEHMEVAILLRLKALYNKMLGKYSEAEKLFNESINKLSLNKSDEAKYALAIAAAYNYIGDIRRLNAEYPEALKYYSKAIKICEEKNVLSSLAVFNVNAGEAAYNNNDFKSAKKHIESALKIYNQINFIWERPIAEALMCLICISENKYNSALKYLISADNISKVLDNPKELGIVFKAKAEIKFKLQKNLIDNTKLKEYLGEALEIYMERAVKYLKISKDINEICELSKLVTSNSQSN